MAQLSNTTIRNISRALAKEFAEFVENDERYADLLMELTADFIDSKLGQLTEDIKFDLAFCLSESICLYPMTDTDA